MGTHNHSDEQIFELAKKLQTEYEKKHIYGANIIEELHANENAHSRILRMLIQYRKDGKYPLLQNFIEKVMGLELSMNEPSFANEKGRIDLLIQDNSSAIIIENKIQNAVDQNSQLDRYIANVRKSLGEGKKDNIHVIYLSRDGSKKVSENSLSPRSKENLGNRFIEKNYKDDILPWVSDLKENEILVKEPLLSSALTQYHDFLEKMFLENNEEENKLRELYTS